ELKRLAASHRMMPLFRSLIAHYEGDLRGSMELRRTMIEWAQRAGHLWVVADASGALANSLYLAGDPVHAVQVFETAGELWSRGSRFLEVAFRALAVLLEVEMGRPEDAATHLEVCRKIIARGEDWSGRLAIVDRAEGVLAAAQQLPFAPLFE